jgi:hypothetical protein
VRTSAEPRDVPLRLKGISSAPGPAPSRLPAIAVAVAAGLRRRAVGRHRLGDRLVFAKDRQLGALVAEGCEKIFSEKASGKSTKDRPELEKAINALGTDDCLVLAEWDRATRTRARAS